MSFEPDRQEISEEMLRPVVPCGSARIPCPRGKNDYNLDIMETAGYIITVQVINMMKKGEAFLNRACD